MSLSQASPVHARGSDHPLADWRQRDARYLWHPYARTDGDAALACVRGAKGCRLILEDGREVIDGMASWWCAIHGYNHPRLNQAVTDQLQAMSHVMFGGLTHEPALELAERLVRLTPDGLDRVFLADSGSVAVEVAAKMALQSQFARGRTARRKLLTVRGGYYGDTTGAMSLCDPVNGMHGHFHGAILEQVFAPAPLTGNAEDMAERPQDLIALERVLDDRGDECAAMILEPLVQGAGGMRFYRPDYVREASRMARERGLLVIFDEIATGFGRTGSLFALDQCRVVPDLLCLGKALTGGYMTLAAVIASEDIARDIAGAKPGVFMHGPTFMGNPLACRVACASIDLLLRSPWRERVHGIERQLWAELFPLAGLAGVRDVRVKGAIGVVELVDAVPTAALCRAFLDQGVWIRPFGRLVYLMPPYVIEPSDLTRLTRAIRDELPRFLAAKKNPRHESV